MYEAYSGVWSSSKFLFFSFRFRPKMSDLFSFFDFRPENEIAFSVLFIFRPKKENPFTVGL